MRFSKIVGRTDQCTPPYTPIIITCRIHTASLPLINTHVYYVPHVREIRTSYGTPDVRGLGRGLSVEPPRQTRARRTANRAS